MDSGFLFNLFVFLAAVAVVVPLTGRFHLGSVLGYLATGILIGPFGFGFIGNAGQVMHFAEFGVVMMLFLIGLELEPPTLWRLRKMIMGLGGLQVAATSAVFTAIGLWLGYGWQASLAAGMALSLSSTALVLQMLEEKGLLQTSAGESSFAVLLFQDLAVIPMLLILPLLAGTDAAPLRENLLSGLPGWLQPVTVAVVMLAIVMVGRMLSRHLFRFVAKTNLREIFTATALALIVGVTLLMQLIGISPALGVFVAGVVLANSEYRHTLKMDIEPFKGMLLGLFFVSVGMSMNFALLAAKPTVFALAVAVLIAVKLMLLGVLGRLFGLRYGQNTMFAVALAQGSEFAFVLFQYTDSLGILSSEQSAFLVMAVALSMAATPLLLLISERFVIPRFMSVLKGPEYDNITNDGNPVIIAGYGRFGQIIGRFLKAQGIGVTVLEKDPDQIELIRKFGGQGYFGDASRWDLLMSAGADRAKLLVVAVDDPDKSLEIVRLVRQEFPNLTIVARARNRRHAYELYKSGAHYFRRETFDASLAMAQEVMRRLGASPEDSMRKATQFKEHDEAILTKSFEFFEKEPELISFTRQASGELERILRDDLPQA